MKKTVKKAAKAVKTLKKAYFVLDTSAVIEKIASSYLKEKKITEGTFIIPHAVVAELESQANKGRDIGMVGLEEIQEMQQLCKRNKKVRMEFYGKRPTETQIKFAKSGEIDAYIREIAVEHNALLITADFVQAESAKAFGLDVDYVVMEKYHEKLSLETFFDKHTMSIHLKETCIPLAKRGKPGDWELIPIGKKAMVRKDMQELAKEIVEKTRLDESSFVEISRKGSTIVQYQDIRIVMVKPPIADGWEITAVRPIVKKQLEEYKLPTALMDRIKNDARGIIVSGETGSGKSCFVQALGEFYGKRSNIVKTVESPRDLQLSQSITQYSKNFTSSEEIHDILFLSRPDKILFDEVRDNPDFQLYIDLRLAGSVIGVVHAVGPIDAIQRFIPRMETGMIPSIIDTVIFIDKGQPTKVLTLKMTVKVPAGMTESDLARPVIEVIDFTTNTSEFEIYSYGEETVIIPVNGENQSSGGVLRLAEQEIEEYFKTYSRNVKAEAISANRVRVYVPEQKIPQIIGSGGKNIMAIEEDLGISIEIKELKEEKLSTSFDIAEDKKYVRIYTDPGKNLDVFIDGNFLLSAISSKKGEIKVHKKSMHGRELLTAMQKKEKIEVRS